MIMILSFYLGENTEKCTTFSVPIEKEVTKINKEGNGNIITISYKVKFIGSAKFMAISLSSLADNLVEEIHKVKCKACDCFLEYESDKVNSIKYKIIEARLTRNLKSDLRQHLSFQIMIPINLFCC